MTALAWWKALREGLLNVYSHYYHYCQIVYYNNK